MFPNIQLSQLLKIFNLGSNRRLGFTPNLMMQHLNEGALQVDFTSGVNIFNISGTESMNDLQTYKVNIGENNQSLIAEMLARLCGEILIGLLILIV